MPATALGKIGTTVMIFLGLGVFVVAVQQFGRVVIETRRDHTEWLIKHLRHRNRPGDGDGPEG